MTRKETTKMKKLILALVPVFVLVLGYANVASACDGKCGGKGGDEKKAECGKAGGEKGACACGEGKACEKKGCGCAEGKPCDQCPMKDCPHKGKAEAGEGKGGCPHQAAVSGAKVPADKIGQEATCPVSGKKFQITENTPFSEYEGQTYFFCCGGCKPKFDQDPGKYLGKK